MPILFKADTSKFRRFPAFADRLMRDAVKDGTQFGERRMVEIVPKGAGTLAGAVYGDHDTVVGPSHFLGRVGVDEQVAPHAGKVNRGTGIDGPFNQPVTITRPARNNPNKPGMMRFFKAGEGDGKGIYRARVKFRPSSKIERGKNFLGKTYDSMVVWTQVRAVQIVADIAGYFARK